MRERYIVFNELEVCAALSNEKTQFRRVIKPAPEPLGDGFMLPLRPNCPYGYIGDQLLVKETWTQYPIELNPQPEDFWYKADGKNPPVDNKLYRWRSPIHMPREAIRLILEITNVRIERLKSISKADAIAEGIDFVEGTNVFKNYQILYPSGWFYPHKPIDSFRTLWDSINVKKHPWDSNPWIWVVEFKLLSKQSQ